MIIVIILTCKYVGSSRNIWARRNIGCFTRDIHEFMTRSCSATIGTP